MAASSSGPVRLVVPRVSNPPIRPASPARSAGSSTAPARVNARTATIGTAGRSATSSTMPFGSTSRCASGPVAATARAPGPTAATPTTTASTTATTIRPFFT